MFYFKLMLRRTLNCPSILLSAWLHSGGASRPRPVHGAARLSGRAA